MAIRQGLVPCLGDKMNRNEQVLKNVVHKQNKDKADLSRKKTGGQTGQCMVTRSNRMVNGCICQIEILSNGRGTGIIIDDAVCRGAFLSAGTQTTFTRNNRGKIELTGGGGSGNGTVTNITNTNYVTAIPRHGHSGYYDGGYAGFYSGSI